MKTFNLVLTFIFIGVMTGFAGTGRQGHHPGIHEKNGIAYRTFNKGDYRVLDTVGFYLYSHEQLVQGMKIARPGTVYYFSTDGGSTILPLTITNLEKTYTANHTFCYRLHTDFNSDNDLVTWLPSLKTFKIKYAYAQSSK